MTDVQKWAAIAAIVVPIVGACIAIGGLLTDVSNLKNGAWSSEQAKIIEEKIKQGMKDDLDFIKRMKNEIPIGTILPFSGLKEKIPTGWEICVGQEKSITEAKELFDIIGRSWGGGKTHFYLPDLQGRFLRGVDDESNRDPDKDSRTASNKGGNTGNNVGSIQEDYFKSHDHGVNDPGHDHLISQQAACGCDPSLQGRDFVKSEAYPGAHRSDKSQTQISTVIEGGKETRPKNAYVYWIIKVKN